MLPRAQIESASDIAERELFDAIVDGRIPPGSPLRLKDLSEQLGMSMMPVREAIGRLAALDLVEIEPRKGARVRELTLEDLEDTYVARLHLETVAVWEAAQRFTADDGAKAAAALADRDAAQAAGNRVAARDAHERFHFAIYEASHRSWLVRSILPAWRNSERYREGSLRRQDVQGVQAQRNNEHSQILSALIRGDGPDAVRWMTAHLTTSVRLSAQTLAAETGESGQEPVTPKVGALLSRLEATGSPISEAVAGMHAAP